MVFVRVCVDYGALLELPPLKSSGPVLRGVPLVFDHQVAFEDKHLAEVYNLTNYSSWASSWIFPPRLEAVVEDGVGAVYGIGSRPVDLSQRVRFTCFSELIECYISCLHPLHYQPNHPRTPTNRLRRLTLSPRSARTGFKERVGPNQGPGGQSGRSSRNTG